MAVPQQKPARSVQDVATPRDFLDAVERRFGPIALDLAANAGNSVKGNKYFGPGSTLGCTDSLGCDWTTYGGLLWLNPPYGDLTTWAKKCAEERARGARIALLAPASTGSIWFAEHVWPHAYVLLLRPRLTFVGHTAPYPKDLMLALYEPGGLRGIDLWRWKP
jgi:phage N-6-adenine-methyltransferase